MKRCIGVLGFFFLAFLGFIEIAIADLNIFIGDLNRQAYADRNDYSYKISDQFGVPVYRVDSIMRGVREPADAFMCFQLSRMLNISPERVFETYQSSRGRGWGDIAKRLGIKPGSPEFQALKNGDFSFSGKHGQKYEKHDDRGYSSLDDHQNGKGKYKGKEQSFPDKVYLEESGGKGKGKGHNK